MIRFCKAVLAALAATTIILCGSLWPLSGRAGQGQEPNAVARITPSEDGESITITWEGTGSQKYEILIDDDPGFRRPFYTADVTGRSVTLSALENGLLPGLAYYLRIEPGDVRESFTVPLSPLMVHMATRGYVHRAYENIGRAWLEKYSGVHWEEESKNWRLIPEWPYAENLVAQQAYYLEYGLRPAVQMALVDRDAQLSDELARFLLVYEGRFTTLGKMRAQASALMDISLLEGQGDGSVRTLQWIEPMRLLRKRIRECLLCNSQFFHPVARLIRTVSTFPVEKRSPAMVGFVQHYAPLVVRDHLLRVGYVATFDYWGAKDLPKTLVRIWQAIHNSSESPRVAHQHAMLDRDLWLIATAVEMLAAHANDPDLVPLAESDESRLRFLVKTGMELFQAKCHVQKGLKDFQGEEAEGFLCFAGDFEDHPDTAYAGYTGSELPKASEKRPRKGISWDVSHSYRIPVVLRSLFENRKAAGLAFPTAADLRRFANQYTYGAFQGKLPKPLFNNFLDGWNGWYRVGYSRKSTGYPPAEYCDSRTHDRFCLVAAVWGWGRLAAGSRDLRTLETALIRLAESDDPEDREFRDRHYTFQNEGFALSDANGREQYPFLLFACLGDVYEWLPEQPTAADVSPKMD